MPPALLIAFVAWTGLIPAGSFWIMCALVYILLIPSMILVRQICLATVEERTQASLSHAARRSVAAFCIAMPIVFLFVGHTTGLVPDCQPAILEWTGGGCVRIDLLLMLGVGTVLAFMRGSAAWWGHVIDQLITMFLLFRTYVSMRASDVGGGLPLGLPVLSHTLYNTVLSVMKAYYFDHSIQRSLSKRTMESVIMVFLYISRLPWPEVLHTASIHAAAAAAARPADVIFLGL